MEWAEPCVACNGKDTRSPGVLVKTQNRWGTPPDVNPRRLELCSAPGGEFLKIRKNRHQRYPKNGTKAKTRLYRFGVYSHRFSRLIYRPFFRQTQTLADEISDTPCAVGASTALWVTRTSSVSLPAQPEPAQPTPPPPPNPSLHRNAARRRAAV